MQYCTFYSFVQHVLSKHLLFSWIMVGTDTAGNKIDKGHASPVRVLLWERGKIDSALLSNNKFLKD